MANFFYFDQANQKQGPYNEQQLQALAVQGIITPNTPLEAEGGHRGTAGQIPGLNFNPAAQTPFAQPSGMYAQGSPAYPPTGTTSGGSIFSWLFDFAFRDIRIHIATLWICKICYAVCCIAAILFGLLWSFTLFANIPQFAVVIVPLLWLGVVLYVLSVRLMCEFYIIVIDWITETKKAAQIYIENNQTK